MTANVVGAVCAGVATAAAILALVLRGSVALAVPAHPEAGALADVRWRGGLRRWEALRAAALGAGAIAVSALGLPPPLAAAGLLAPSVWLHAHAGAARERARRSLLPLMVSVEASLRSGTSLPDALRRSIVAVDDAVASRPLAAALREFDRGAGLDAALASSAGRSRDPRLRAALGTLALGIRERLPRERLGDLLSAIVDRLTFEDGVADEVRARAAGARQQQSLIALLVPAIAIYLAVTMPALGATLASDLGRYGLVPAAAALEIGGIVLSGRVVRGALP